MLSEHEQQAYYQIIADIIESKDLILLDWLIGSLLYARAKVKENQLQ
jgi:hypothetical protein